MKQFFTRYPIAVFILLLSACNKDFIEQNVLTPTLNPTINDANGGNWVPIHLSTASEITVLPPIAKTAPDYTAQINEIKGWQKNMSDDDRKLVKYWSAGGVLRWNEIMRELVAKYNLPPVQDVSGTYPIPNANNPLAYPFFPFSNPPYAARAYAYVSAAQYDALVAAYHYKTVYKREAPYLADLNINVLVSKSSLYSYPSEDAAVIGASVELLKLLFPGEQAYIQKKAEEHRRARLIAGANVRDEMEAGEALGRAVALKYVQRARTDRTGAALGITNGVDIWKELETGAIQKGETPWISQDSPRRPPMLPYFGRVRPFLFDELTVVTKIRPPAPPSVKSEAFKKELEEVLYFSQNPTRERVKIVHRWGDGVGTYTPPGHWNAIAAEHMIPLNLSEIRWARNLALLNMSLMDAAIVCWDAKYTYYNPRPSQVDPKIKTHTGLPNFPAYTSGHSTFSGAAATILAHLIPEKANLFNDMALEASMSRIYGAIHYRSDCEVGLEMGKKVGNYAIQRAQNDGAN
ncbi:phosphatase PAP2 family protein [Daejeonella sp.]|uniref:phosphatase PAP2 family protein n=1 Tax=Daejeonella sp. TaxID=2805397 RepID=UPI002730EC3B|nr:phosphatase PAP2 family protein [Daejeonella sp.]MDP2414148.1 phosphatase PAP2 family protein [Daejeonella sp.]